MRTHTANEVAEVLIGVFAMFRFLDELLSDCDSEFMSDLIQIFLHPQTKGCLERFNRTLKDMLAQLANNFLVRGMNSYRGYCLLIERCKIWVSLRLT